MDRKRNGFFMLDLLGVTAVVAVTLISIFSCYHWSLGVMLRHNQRQEAWEIAKRAKIGQYATVDLGGQEDYCEGSYRVRVLRSAGMAGTHGTLEIQVYWGEETQPLVNLVSYE